jgi:hypothetical protein
MKDEFAIDLTQFMSDTKPFRQEQHAIKSRVMRLFVMRG